MLYSSSKPSIRDEIGQMLIIGFDGKTVGKDSWIVQTLQKNNIGGVVLFDYNVITNTFDKNIESPAQVKKLNHDLQHYVKEGNVVHRRKNVPLLIAVDYEGGEVNRLHERYGFVPIPSAEEVGKKSPDEIKAIAKTMAKTLHTAGFNLDFAPVVDVNVNPDNPIIGKKRRSFSSNPDEVVADAGIYSRAFLKQHLQCAYKHFPGHGSAHADSHLGFVDVSDTWSPLELQPYMLLLQQPFSCGAVMTAHVVNRALDPTGLPATLSHQILTGLLREDLHFDGVIITDDMQMKAIRDHYGFLEALTLAINAGADMVIIANALPGSHVDPNTIIDLLEQKVISGEIPRARIDDAYRHIVHLKTTLLKH